jgi:hypothetical protein
MFFKIKGLGNINSLSQYKGNLGPSNQRNDDKKHLGLICQQISGNQLPGQCLKKTDNKMTFRGILLTPGVHSFV